MLAAAFHVARIVVPPEQSSTQRSVRSWTPFLCPDPDLVPTWRGSARVRADQVGTTGLMYASYGP